MGKKHTHNAAVVERKDGHHQLSGSDLQQYRDQMQRMFRDTKLPAVLYKGKTVPRRVLSDFSYLTAS